MNCFSPAIATAGWIGRMALTAGEEYNDNIFFSNRTCSTPSNPPPPTTTCQGKRIESDFITQIVPTFGLLYVPTSQETPTFIANLSPSGQIFAKNSDLSNFGDNTSFDASWKYQPTRRLIFNVNDAFFRGGATRTGLTALGQEVLPTTPTSFQPVTTPPTLPVAQDLAGIVSEGSTLGNAFGVNAAYLATPTITLYGRYGLNYTNFDKSSGDEFAHTIGFRGAYSGFRNHNIFAGYSITFVNSRNAKNADTVIHNIEVGDDYFSLFRVKLTPTLTLSATSGVSLNTSGHGPGIANNSSVTLIKVWETAVLNAGYRSGLGTSFGLSEGAAQTRTLFAGFGIRVTKELTGSVGVDYTKFESSDVDFSTFRASGGLQYWISPWLSSTLWYGFRWRNTQDNTDVVNKGKAQGNSIILALTAHFDLFPRVGLSRAGISSIMFEPGLPPFAPPPSRDSGTSGAGSPSVAP